MSDDQRGPIFIVGSMRSGSTMLRLILDSHPHIAIGAETGFMSGLRGVKEVPNWQFGKGWFERLNWSEQEMNEHLRQFYDDMFRRHALGQGKERWGEKTPFHTAHIDEMARVFPDAVFVGIVRHPGAVAASLRKNFHYTFTDAVSYWAAANLDLVSAGSKLGGRFTLCRYEDLVCEGEQVLRELMAAIEEPWHPNLLEHHRVQREQGAPRAVEGSTITRDPIDATRAGRWIDGVTDDALVALDRTVGLAGLFGYEPRDPTPSQRLTPRKSARAWVADGGEVAQRFREWESRVDAGLYRSAPVVDARPEELAARLTEVEQALTRLRSRRVVRLADALRKVQRGRSVADVRAAWSIVRPGRGEPSRKPGRGAR